MTESVVIDLRKYDENSYGREEKVNYLSPKLFFKEVLNKINSPTNFKGVVLVGRCRKNNLDGYCVDLFNKGWIVLEEDGEMNNYIFSTIGQICLNITENSLTCVSNPITQIKNKEIVEIQIYNDPKPSAYIENDIYYPYSCLYPPSKNILKQVGTLSNSERKIDKRFNI